MPRKKKEVSTPLQDFLSEAHERFKLSSDAEAEWRRESLEDWRFYSGDQWPADIRSRRKDQPCLTINRLKAFKRIVTNEERQNRPAVKVDPVGDGADVEDAKIMQGLARHYEVLSSADTVYDITFEQMVIGGFGWLRVLTKYRSGKTFAQDVWIEGFDNPFCVYDDPAAVLPDRVDAEFRFIIKDFTQSAYKRLYPTSEAASLNDFSSVGDNVKEWLTKDSVRVAEYYYIDHETQTIYEGEDGEVSDKLREGARSRQLDVKKVKWAKINAVECLEGGPGNEIEVPCDWIPLIPCIGEDMNINGKRVIAGLVRDAKDAQRAFNYWKSKATEAIALAPLSPFVAAEGQIEGREAEWKTANVQLHSVLQYKPITDGAQNALPPPSRNSAEPPIQAMTVMLEGAANDLSAVTGINDASLGQRRPDESGKAVLLRQKQGDVSTLHFSDNLSRTIRLAGKTLLQFARRVEDYPHIQRIINPDGTVDHVVMHAGEEQLGEAQQLVTDAIKKVFDVSTGEYDVTVSVGPSYQTKRQEAVASIMALIQAAPNILNIVGDLLVGNMDWNNSQEIAARLKKMLPPQVLDDESDDPNVKLQKSQAQLQAMAQMTQQLTEALKQANQIINTKQLELESKERIAAMNNQAGMIEAMFKADAQGARLAMQEEFKALNHRMELLHNSITIDQETRAEMMINQHAADIAPPPTNGNGTGAPAQ